MKGDDFMKNSNSALENLKMETATELGVDLKSYDLKSKDAGSVGGNMVKKLIEKGESSLGSK
jgi:hypothetical protein